MWSDFSVTDNFKYHPPFGTDPCVLQILLYFGEVEVCSPVGSRENKHKHGKSFFQLLFLSLLK